MTHHPEADSEFQQHENRTFVVIGINNVKIVAAMIETIRSSYRGSITSEIASNMQLVFRYGFKYDIHNPHDSLAHYHRELKFVVSTIPMHQDIVTLQWETREGPKTSDESSDTARVFWRTGHRLEFLTLGTHLFNTGNLLSKKNNFRSALFNYRGALEVIKRAQMVCYWQGANLERLLPYLEAIIRYNLRVCCAKQAVTTNNIPPDARQFYLAEIQLDRLESEYMTWGKGPMALLIAILQISAQQNSGSIVKKLELFIRHSPEDEKKVSMARSLIELVKSPLLNQSPRLSVSDPSSPKGPNASTNKSSYQICF
ncbi:hypothetical protein TWF481_006211 [Arthrobotrys musiformis]|uniref:Trafficking protein particle complex subunit 11 domain-containing protein n=1 Tax=Arthrobotrys musiformis TaxID=47236 RepID=A0AAV9VT08_9PEZI